MDTLRTFKVTPEDIEKTYHPMNWTYREYQEVMQHVRQSGGTLGSLARKRGLSRTRDRGTYKRLDSQMTSWVGNGRIPPPVKTICALHEMGIFPGGEGGASGDPLGNVINDELLSFTHGNAHFGTLNLLSSTQYWRGYFIDEGGDQPIFRIDAKYIDEPARKMVEGLLGKPLTNAKNDVLFDALCARFLKVFGAPQGDRNIDEYFLPRPIELSLGTLNNDKSSLGEIEVAQRAVRDFVLAAWYTGKIRHTKSRGHMMIINGSYKEEITDRRTTDICRAIKASQLPVETRVVKKKEYSRKAKAKAGMALYSSHVSFHGINEGIVNGFMEEFRERMESASHTRSSS